MRVSRRGWWELVIFLVTSAVIVIIVFVQTKNMAWRVLSFPVGILFAVCIAYWAPNSVLKIKRAKHNGKIRKKARIRLHQHFPF